MGICFVRKNVLNVLILNVIVLVFLLLLFCLGYFEVDEEFES